MAVVEHATTSTSQRWVFVLTVAFLYAAAVLRSVLEFDGGHRALALVLLLLWLALLLAGELVERLWAPGFALWVALQAAVVAFLMTLSESSDFFAILLAVPSMQAMQRWRPRSAWILIGLFGVLTGLCLIDEFGTAQAVVLAVIYTAADIFLATFALASKRASDARQRNEELVRELEDANRRTAEYAHRVERLAGARERQRLARELHDSVTQTLFSMTLTARSAALLLTKDSGEVGPQLDQLEHLAHHALSEMSVLSGQTAAPAVQEGLLAGLRDHLTERLDQDGLVISLEVEGDAGLPPEEEAALLRIVQEALNNVVKHAGVSRAVVRVRLRSPLRVEVEDEGRGFDPEQARGRGVGLTSMSERADELGWKLMVTSSPGHGTRVVAEQVLPEGGRSDGGR